MVALLASTAKSEDIDLFPRFDVMKRWHDVDHLGFDAFVAPDGLHMNDWGYGCWAKLLSASIVEAATRPTAAAHVAPGLLRPKKPATQ